MYDVLSILHLERVPLPTGSSFCSAELQDVGDRNSEMHAQRCNEPINSAMADVCCVLRVTFVWVKGFQTCLRSAEVEEFCQMEPSGEQTAAAVCAGSSNTVHEHECVTVYRRTACAESFHSIRVGDA